MKRFLCCLVVALAVGGWLPGVAWADEAAICYNGERQECNAWLKDDVAFVPLRAVCDLFGIEVHYDGVQNMVQLYDGQYYYRFYLNDGSVLDKGFPTEPPATPPLERDGRIWLPLRYLAELLDVQIEWNEDDWRVECFKASASANRAAEEPNGSWLKVEQRDKIVECLKTIAVLPALVDEQADTLVNPAKLQVARPIQAYYYNGADFEELYILYPLVYQGSVKYLISARQRTGSPLENDIAYSFNEKRYTPAVKQVLDAGGALALVHDANRTYIYDGTNWQLIYEVKDVHLRDPEGPELDLTAQVDASSLQLTAFADPVSVEDAYLGRLPRVAPTAD